MVVSEDGAAGTAGDGSRPNSAVSDGSRPTSAASTQVLLNIAGALLGTDDAGLEAEMVRSLRLIGPMLSIHALSICVPNGQRLVNLGQWREQLGWLVPPAFELDLERATWIRNVLEEPREVVIDSLVKVPRTAMYEHHVLSSRKLSSLAIFPIYRPMYRPARQSIHPPIHGPTRQPIHPPIHQPLHRPGTVYGYLVAELYQEPRRWQPEELTTLDSLAGLLAMAMARRAHERTLMASAHAAERRAQRQNQLLARFAQQLRAPLTAVMGYAEMLAGLATGAGAAGGANGANGANGDRPAKYLGELIERGRTMASLIDDAVLLADIEHGAVAPVLTRVDVVELMRTAVRQAAARARGSELLAELPDSGEYVFADPGMLSRLVITLLVHAAHTGLPGGRIVLSLSMRADDYDIQVRTRDLAGSKAGEARAAEAELVEARAKEAERGKARIVEADEELADARLSLIERLARLHEGVLLVAGTGSNSSVVGVTLPRRPVVAGRPGR